MPAAPIAADELARLDALWRAAILDTAPEDFFEDVVDLVQVVSPAPIVLVSLVDEHRQWFKARRGVEDSETPRDHAICAYAILGDDPLVVPDTRADSRFADNPSVTGSLQVAAYAGAPIILQGGAHLGTVCAIDRVPRNWRREEIENLQRCARMVARHIDARRARLEEDRHRFLEMALTRAEVRYQSIVESMSEGMVVHGRSGGIIDSNPAAWSILGLTRDELFGLASNDPRWRAVDRSGEPFPGDLHPAMVTFRTGQPQAGVVMGVETPKGERRWITINSYPVRRPDTHEVDQVVVVFRLRDAPSGDAWRVPAPANDPALS